MYQGNNKIAQVKALVARSGGWSSVFSAFDGLAYAFRKGDKQQPCPLTGNGRTKFRFFRDADETGGAYHNDYGAMPDGIDVIAWYMNTGKNDAMNEIVRILGGDLRSVSEMEAKNALRKQNMRSQNRITPEEAEKNKVVLSRIKRGAQPIAGTHAEAYLRSRGIQSDLSRLSELGFHPALKTYNEDEGCFITTPGMLAMVRDVNGKAVTMHRTFLDANQPSKANLPKPKMLLKAIADVRGCSIQLDQPTDYRDGMKVLGVAEGIENALSVREATGCPMWVGISDRLMEMMKLPEDVGYVIIWADIEPSGAGLAAAERMKERLEKEGRVAIIRHPEIPEGVDKIDWNDVYMESGVNGFPQTIIPQCRIDSGVSL